MEASDGVPTVTPEAIKTLCIVQTSSGHGFKAFYPPTRSHVYVKLFSSRDLNERNHREICEEVKFVRQIKSDKLMEIIGVYKAPMFFGILTDWMPNGSLSTLIHERKLYSVLPPCVCIRILTDIARGLCHLHEQLQPITHQALKPSNILLDHQYQVKLSDFGMPYLQTLSSICSNANKDPRVYLSPERIKGYCPTPADDVYSFGITAWELFSRMKPFHDENSLKLETLISMGLRPQPNVEAFLKPEEISPTLINCLVQQINLCWHGTPSTRPKMTESYFHLWNILQTFSEEQMNTSLHSLIREKEITEKTIEHYYLEIDIGSLGYSDGITKNNQGLRNRSLSTPEGRQTTSYSVQHKGKRSESLPVFSTETNSYTPSTGSHCNGLTQLPVGSWNAPFSQPADYRRSHVHTEPSPTSPDSLPVFSPQTNSCTPSMANHCTATTKLQTGSWNALFNQPDLRRSHVHTEPSPTSPGISWSSSDSLILCREDILHSMTEGRLNQLLDTIFSQNLFCRDEYENVKAKPTLTDRTRAFLDTCQEKGEEVANAVLLTLRKNGFTTGFYRNPA
ncbi:receptor-interacting serine/threonine-protein kinase 2 [Bombina bombina]|uniref:receptor-interacting serine/threonine-protein kinase 2 n=1 Tax=Bombina bombina TaxID=8345 RepID=UPI00235B072E|nr:receptor-interacting serine/threonine-protein kinase 2 [Bombina bombina]XP_053556497.1 receptor-interacting serine/threonine-protein kinase 2 [Bombina bombina]